MDLKNLLLNNTQQPIRTNDCMFSLLKLVNIWLEMSKHSTHKISKNSRLTPPQSNPERKKPNQTHSNLTDGHVLQLVYMKTSKLAKYQSIMWFNQFICQFTSLYKNETASRQTNINIRTFLSLEFYHKLPTPVRSSKPFCGFACLY